MNEEELNKCYKSCGEEKDQVTCGDECDEKYNNYNDILNNITSDDLELSISDNKLVCKLNNNTIKTFNISNEKEYLDIIDYDKYLKFINAISIGYDRNVLYHNDIHAADVLQTAYTIMTSCDIKTLMKLSIHDVVALCVACSCHDFKHNGFTNLFHQNDMSILSSFHIHLKPFVTFFIGPENRHEFGKLMTMPVD